MLAKKTPLPEDNSTTTDESNRNDFTLKNNNVTT